MWKKLRDAIFVIVFGALILYVIWLIMSTAGNLPPFVHKGKIILGGFPSFKI